MKMLCGIVLMFVAMVVSAGADTEIGWDSKGNVSNELINLKIKKDDWGKAPPHCIGMLLSTVIRDFAVNFPDVKKEPIIVQHTKGFPMCVLKKTGKGERVILIASQHLYWSQFSYQFAHELCHAMCMTTGETKKEGTFRHLWLEESFSECASYYTMRKMSETWKTQPPYDRWKDYAPNLSSYVATTIDNYHKAEKIPEGQTFAEWFKTKEAVFATNCCVRELNSIVAEQLLPLLEKNPGSWEAVVYARLKPANSLSEVMNNWYYAAPEKHREFVKQVMKIFDVKLLSPEELQKEIEKNKK